MAGEPACNVYVARETSVPSPFAMRCAKRPNGGITVPDCRTGYAHVSRSSDMPAQPQTTLPPLDYHAWRQRSVNVGGRAYPVASKPGLANHGRDDAAPRLLAERVAIPPGATVVCLNAGSGLFGAVAAARGAAHVILTDRSAIAVEAARRTMAANGVSTASVLSGHGSAPLDPATVADLVTIRIPTDKLSLLQLLGDAFRLLRVGGRCCIAGATNEGIKSAATLLQRLFGNATVLGTDSGHRAVMATKHADTPADVSVITGALLEHDAFHEIDVTLRGRTFRLHSRPGVFSWEHLDEATELLANVMEIRASDHVLDLGCGSGPLAILAATLATSGAVTMVDVDSEAVRCALRSVETAGLQNCDVQLSDVGSALPDRHFDAVVCNPPFHMGKGTDLDIPHQFIIDSHRVLRHGGHLQLVANRTLPYERIISATFGNLRTLHDGARFKVIGATRQR